MKTFEGSLVRRNRTSGIIAFASIPILMVASIVAAVVRSEIALVLASYGIWPWFIALAHHLGWLRPKTTRASRFDVSKGTVSADGMKLRHVTRARIIPQPPGRPTVVEIGRRFDPYPARVALPTQDNARDFIRALGLDSREGATRFHGPLTEITLAAAIVVGLAFAAAVFAALGVLGLPLALIALVMLARALVSTFTIGHDGILIERFPRKRFLPYANVTSLEREVRHNFRGQPMVSRGFWVTLDSGERFFIDTTRERMRDYMFEGDHLFDAAVQAHALVRTERSRPADVLARGTRSTNEWLRDLDVAREAHYRVAAIPDEDLALMLADPSADKTARVAAAICLAHAGEEARVRVRVAAEDIAEPDVRAAALAATNDDEEALTAALEALE